MQRIDAIHRLRARASKPDMVSAATPVPEITEAARATFRIPKTVAAAAAAAAGAPAILLIVTVVVAFVTAFLAAHAAWDVPNKQAQMKRAADSKRRLCRRRPKNHRFKTETPFL